MEAKEALPRKISIDSGVLRHSDAAIELDPLNPGVLTEKELFVLESWEAASGEMNSEKFRPAKEEHLSIKRKIEEL